MLAKSDLIWFGSRVSLNMLSANALELQVGVDTIHPATSVRDLGVLLDSELTTSHHVSNVASCFFQLRRLRQDRHILSREVTALLISAFVVSRLDYCNSVLAGPPRSTTEPLQRALDAAARLVVGLRPFDHVTPAYEATSLSSH